MIQNRWSDLRSSDRRCLVLFLLKYNTFETYNIDSEDFVWLEMAQLAHRGEPGVEMPEDKIDREKWRLCVSPKARAVVLEKHYRDLKGHSFLK